MTPTMRPTLSADEVCALLGLTGPDRRRQLHRAVWRRAAPPPLPRVARQDGPTTRRAGLLEQHRPTKGTVMHNRIHPLMADVIGAHFGPPAPLVEPAYRDDRQRVDVALAAATSVMRQKLEDATGDRLDEAVALRIMAAATAAFSAAMAAQMGGTR